MDVEFIRLHDIIFPAAVTLISGLQLGRCICLFCFYYCDNHNVPLRFKHSVMSTSFKSVI